MGPPGVTNMRRALLFLLPAALLSCRGSDHLALQHVRVAIHREPIGFLPLRVARALGYFEAEGLSVDMPEVAGGAKAIEALLGGSVDVAAGSMSDVVQLAAEGHRVREFLVVHSRPAIALAAAPGEASAIRTVRDLKGRTVGVSASGSASHQFLNFLLASNGLPPDEVSVVPVGLAASSVAALEHRKVDAAVLLASAITQFESRHPGQAFIADTRTAAEAERLFGSSTFPGVSLVAEDAWLSRNTETARRLVRAVKNGMRWVREHPAEQVREMIPEPSRMELAADLQAIRGVQEEISVDGLMTRESAELIEKFVAISNPRVHAAHIDLTQLYTNEFAAARHE